MNIKHATIGVIGFGNFGKVVCNNLFPKNEILLHTQQKGLRLSKRITVVDSIKVLVEKSDIIIPCVPIRKFEEVIQEIANFIKAETIVMDICSVKAYPVAVMKKHLPNNVSIVATHPMFGPNSIKKRGGLIDGLTMITWNVSAHVKQYKDVVMHCKKLGLHMLEMSPDRHDELSANSQFFSLCIGEMAQTLHLTATDIDTPGAKAVFEAMQYMGADRHIIEDMANYNVYCKKLLEEMITVLVSLRGGKNG